MEEPRCYVCRSSWLFEIKRIHLPAVTNNDLRGVLVWHNNGWASQSRAMSVGVVLLERLSSHTSVEVVSDLVCVSVQNKELTVSKKLSLLNLNRGPILLLLSFKTSENRCVGKKKLIFGRF